MNESVTNETAAAGGAAAVDATVRNKVVVITGAGSGFGALAERAPAHAGHTVYAAMRNATTRNAGRFAETAAYAAEHGVDLRIVELDVLSLDSADSAFRVHVDPANDGIEAVSAVADRIRADFLIRIGLGDLLTPHMTSRMTPHATSHAAVRPVRSGS